MRDRLDEVGDDMDVVLVTFTSPTNLEWYAAVNGPISPILIDRERSAYRAFGLGRGSIRRVYGWRAARRYFELFRSGRLHGWTKPTEDTLQLGGDFIVDATGVLVYGHWGLGPDDRPSVDELIAAIQRLGPSASG